jgi:hypothetical protein
VSERGSFVTEYIYCPQCLEAAKAVLLSNEKYLCSCVLPSWEGPDLQLPIIAGKIGGLYKSQEIVDFESDYAVRLARTICHPMRVVVLADSGDAKCFCITPDKSLGLTSN